MKTIGVPAGIGDFSWIWSKLCHVMDQIDKFWVADGWPYRTQEYIEACGKPATYMEVQYTQILMFEQVNPFKTWADIVEHQGASFLLEANRHLERGERLEDWLPDLPTQFHYPFRIKREALESATQIMLKLRDDADGGPLLGVSCASYRGSEAWKTWGKEEWSKVLLKIIRKGWCPVLLGGFWDDLTYHIAQDLGVPDLVGKTNIQEAIVLQGLLDGYLGFSSGLGVIRTVLDRPVMMLWPEHQLKLSCSWAPMHMLQSNRYVARLWQDPDELWPTLLEFLQRCEYEKTFSTSFHVYEQEYNELCIARMNPSNPGDAERR